MLLLEACLTLMGKLFLIPSRISTVLEEKIAPGLSFQITGEMDYSKGQGGQGKVGVGFTLEA